MLQERLEGAGRARKLYQVTMTNSPEAVREAQRLRYMVFVEEMGARLSTPEPGLDIEIYDPYCQHLLVRDADTEEVVAPTASSPPRRPSASAATTPSRNSTSHACSTCGGAWWNWRAPAYIRTTAAAA